MYYKGLLHFLIEGNCKICIWNKLNSHILNICWYITFPCLFCIWHCHYTVILYIFRMTHHSSITSIASILRLILFSCFSVVYIFSSFHYLFSSLIFICFSALFLSPSWKIFHCPIIISHHNILKLLQIWWLSPYAFIFQVFILRILWLSLEIIPRSLNTPCPRNLTKYQHA